MNFTNLNHYNLYVELKEQQKTLNVLVKLTAYQLIRSQFVQIIRTAVTLVMSDHLLKIVE